MQYRVFNAEGDELFYEMPFDVNTKIFPEDININIPRDYWQEGVQIKPDDVAVRYNLFSLWRSLYDGHHESLLPEGIFSYSLISNYFKDFAEFIGMIMMSDPPEADIDKPLRYELNKALRRTLVDYSRYGTSIMTLYTKDNEDIGINVLDPRYFYTHGNGEYTYLNIGQERLEEYKWLNGIHYMNIWEIKDDSIDSFITDIPLGEYDELPIAIVGRGELDGIWGESMYFDMYQENISITKRLSGLDNVFDLFEKPRLYKYGYADPEAIDAPETEKEREYHEYIRRYALDKGLEIDTDAPKVDFKTPPRFDQATQEFVDRMLNIMHTRVKIPMSLYGYYKGDAASKVTGETMRESQKTMKYYCADLINAYIPEIERLLSIAENREVEVTWMEEQEEPQPDEIIEVDNVEETNENE